jgi:hypothetical protein
MKTVLSIVLVFLVSISFAQTTDQKISDVYGEAALLEMKSNNPGRYKFHVGMVEKGMVLLTAPEDKFLEFPLLDSIPLHSQTGEKVTILAFLQEYMNQTSFNALKYGFSAGSDYMYYRLAGTNQVLMITPQKEFYKN